MAFSFLEYFHNDKYNKKTIIKNNYKDYSLLEIKKLIATEAAYLKTVQNDNIIIDTQNHFDFIIIFMSCIFAEKNIFISNKNKQREIGNYKKIDKITTNDTSPDFNFHQIDTKKIKVTIFTSGTTSEPKIIEKNIDCIIKESHDVIEELSLPQDKNFEFITTTPINHLYAITAYIFMALNSKNIINTDRIDYYESLNINNSILITSPSFLEYMQKYNISPKVYPEFIFSAGANLKEDTHKYLEKYSKVINLYGCTETGFIAYKDSSEKTCFKLLKGINIISSNEKETIVISNYSKEEKIILDDKILLNDNGTILINGRKDRVLKIQEKRVSAVELEEEILKSDYIKNCCLIDIGNKIGALAELTQKGVEYIIQNGTANLIKLLKSDLLKKFGIIPQKWKFIDEIPKNSMSKHDTDKIKSIFSINLSLPYIMERNISANQAEFKLFFYKNCNFFKGHFEKFPIVPGVIQLFYASYFSEIAFNKDCHTGQIKRIKFSNIIHSDTIVNLKLLKNEKGIEFEYSDENKSYSSGCLPLENIFKE